MRGSGETAGAGHRSTAHRALRMPSPRVVESVHRVGPIREIFDSMRAKYLRRRRERRRTGNGSDRTRATHKLRLLPLANSACLSR